MSKSADMRAYAAKLRHERLASAAKFLEFYAAKFCVRMGKICNAFLRGKIRGALLAGRFGAARRSKIRSVKYYAEFYSAVHGDKIYGVMADNKILGTALASVRNSGLKNARVNLRPRNTYAYLKFKGSANFEPAGGVNFKFKNGASFRFLCGGNVRSLKSMSWANALSFSAAAEISDLIKAGEILKYGVTTGISALALASKILIPSIAGKILNLSAALRTDIEFKGAGGCEI
ncbi:hypothetical protein [uncultured Campylobacter sp.]|uniref:hypothetical protein n=1 Tax=uncultured Campylobacter sp. TaxID=218934 RepID=UPI00260BCFD0|nr:hypothetical protein [uncultured Campylobacter sp.]